MPSTNNNNNNNNIFFKYLKLTKHIIINSSNNCTPLNMFLIDSYQEFEYA